MQIKMIQYFYLNALWWIAIYKVFLFCFSVFKFCFIYTYIIINDIYTIQINIPIIKYFYIFIFFKNWYCFMQMLFSSKVIINCMTYDTFLALFYFYIYLWCIIYTYICTYVTMILLKALQWIIIIYFICDVS